MSGGTNFYAYRVFETVNGHSCTVCKVKGITMNSSASRFFNWEIIKDMIAGGHKGKETTVANVHI